MKGYCALPTKCMLPLHIELEPETPLDFFALSVLGPYLKKVGLKIRYGNPDGNLFGIKVIIEDIIKKEEK